MFPENVIDSLSLWFAILAVAREIDESYRILINPKEHVMKFHHIVVVPQEDGPGAEGYCLFLAMGNGALMVGRSRHHHQLRVDYCRQTQCAESDMPPTFAAGDIGPSGELRFCPDPFSFRGMPPDKNQSEVREFLAVEALYMALENAAHNRFLNQAI